MDVNAAVTAISTLGFPIVMCGAMFWSMTKQIDLHKQENAQMIEALNNNTLALNRLEIKMGVDSNEFRS